MAKIALNELPDVVERLLTRLPQKTDGATIVALSGELGAGKTTFVQALARELGITETVQSPTYVLMKRYGTTHPYFKTLVHIDAYRLDNAEEFKVLKPEEFLQSPDNLVCIEWPERVEGALPAPDMAIKFSSEAANEGERYIEVI